MPFVDGDNLRSSERDTCWWRWRFQPVFACWGHLGIDFTFESPHGCQGEFLLRHVDYGLPGDRTHPDYRHSISRYAARVSPNGRDWPPLRTPRGFVYLASPFSRAPRAVGEYLQHKLPRFWGPCGAYRTLGPNSNSGLRAALRACEAATRYRFGVPPRRFRLGAFGWGWPCALSPCNGPYPGYFEDESRFRWRNAPLAPAGDRPLQDGGRPTSVGGR